MSRPIYGSNRHNSPSSVDRRIFAALRDGPLTCLDIVTKCRRSRDTVYNRMFKLRDRGLLAGGRSEDSYLWRLPEAVAPVLVPANRALKRELPPFVPLTLDLDAHRRLALLTRSR